MLVEAPKTTNFLRELPGGNKYMNQWMKKIALYEIAYMIYKQRPSVVQGSTVPHF